MRISTSHIFSQSLQQMNSALGNVTELNMMNSSQKRINRPSDDPSGTGKVMELSSYDQSLSGYLENCSVSNSYLNLADQSLVQASENISAAMETAEQAATETYTEKQLQMMAEEMESYLDSLLTIANTQMGTDSVFAGNDLESNAYSTSLGVTLPNDSLSNASITSLTGEIDSTLYVRFDSDGDVGTDALDYRYSTDGGSSWTSATLAAGDTVLDFGTIQAELATGTTVSTADGEGNGTEFIIREAMQYIGSDDAMSVNISESTETDMTTVGSSIFGGINASTGEPYPEPNLFETISDCIAYMETGNHEGVAECLEGLRDAHELVEAQAANIGARENKITYTQSSLSLVQQITTASISREEDADATQILVELEQANYVYEAVLNSASKIMNMSLLDYI
ncbi:MAG: flagellar hook-associated protein FlgL [Pseudodesulfovibrio sp.]|nr:flagellar hook-associated protein FlgL [Pseudodesulfovibrio sp.]